MQQDMLMRGLGPHTQHDYVRHVRRFAAFLGRSPDTATAEDIRRFQVHQHESGVRPPTINCSVSALRFCFTVTLERRDLSRALVITRYPRKLPEVLSVEEAARLLEAAPGLKYKAALGVAYGAGLRVSEVAHLKVDDIDSKRMLIRVEQGKGRKDRNAMLSPQLLALLRLWWREGKRRGRDAARMAGCSPGAAAPIRSPPGSSIAPSRKPPSRRHPQAGQPAHAAPQLRHPPAGGRTSTSASSRSCSGTPSSRRPRSTPRSRPGRSARSQARSTG